MKKGVIVIPIGVAALAVALLLWSRGGGSDIPTAPLVAEPANPTPPRPALEPAKPGAMPFRPELVLDDDPEGPLRLEGQVIDAGGAPVGGALVIVQSSPPRTIETGSDGSFAFDGLLPRIYTVAARKDDQVGGPVAQRLRETSDPIVIRVAAGATLAVQVVDQAGASMAGATVELRDPAPRALTTDASGEARFAGVHGGSHIVIAGAPGHGVVHHPVEVPERAGAAVETRVILRRGVTISGLVVTESDQPVAGARVVAHDAAALFARKNARLDGVVTDRAGRFTLPAVSAGTYRITAMHPDHAPASSAAIDVISDREVRDVRIVARAGGVVAGEVVSRDGQPAAFATVRVAAAQSANLGWSAGGVRQATAGADGAFRITGLARAELVAMARSETASSPIVHVDLRETAERTDVRFELSIGGIIAGEVVDGAGKPIAEARVTALPDFWGGGPSDDFVLRGITAQTTDGGGRFRFEGLIPGTYRVRAAPSGLRTVKLAQAGVQAATGDMDVRVVLTRPGGITGIVQYEDGGVPDTFTVSVGLPPSLPVASDTGVFTVSDLPKGRHDVTLRGLTFAPRTVRDVEVTSGEITDMGTVMVKRGRALSGRVLDAGGAGVAGAHIIVARRLVGDGRSATASMGMNTDEIFGMRRALSEDDGRFEIIGIGVEELLLVAEHDERGRSLPVVVPAGIVSMKYDVPLLPFGSVYGTVTAGGQPAVGAMVTAMPRTSGQQTLVIQTGTKGDYVFERLAAGSHHIVASVGGQGLLATSSAGVDANVIAGGRVRADIEVPRGDIDITVHIQGKDGAIIDAAQVFLLSSQFAVTTAGELTEALVQGGAGSARQSLAMGTDKVAFSRVAPGAYSVCVVPINGDMNDVSFQLRLQQHVQDLKVYCEAWTVAPAPPKQTHTAAVPPMDPLPEAPE